jgi:hypothetical protein
MRVGFGSMQQNGQGLCVAHREISGIIAAEQSDRAIAIVEASTGTPATSASDTTLAPPSMMELSTNSGARAIARRTAHPGTLAPPLIPRILRRLGARRCGPLLAVRHAGMHDADLRLNRHKREAWAV